MIGGVLRRAAHGGHATADAPRIVIRFVIHPRMTIQKGRGRNRVSAIPAS
jgi:hypothetical protein